MHTFGRAVVAAALLAALCIGVPAAPGRSAALASNATIIVQIGPSTQAITATFGSLSPDWLTPDFDTSFWHPVRRVSADVQRCVAANSEGWQGLPMYWAKDAQHAAYFRQAFAVPAADSYTASALILGKLTGDSLLYIDQQQFADSYSQGINDLGITPYLHAGINILGFYGVPPVPKTASGLPCSAFGFRLIIHAQGVHYPQRRPGAAPHVVALLSPGDGARVVGGTLPLTWSSFPSAAAYMVHLWLRRADPGQSITASTVATASLTVTSTTASIQAANMPKGAYAWSVAALDAQGQIVANWSPARTVLIE